MVRAGFFGTRIVGKAVMCVAGRAAYCLLGRQRRDARRELQYSAAEPANVRGHHSDQRCRGLLASLDRSDAVPRSVVAGSSIGTDARDSGTSHALMIPNPDILVADGAVRRGCLIVALPEDDR